MPDLVQIPHHEKLIFLLYPSGDERLRPLCVPIPPDDKLSVLGRTKVLWGGRSGMKSTGIADAILALTAEKPLRVLCARETQMSIRESVHQVLADRIKELGIGALFDILQYTIRSKCGGEIIFKGIRGLSVEDMKSFEGIDIAWVEEAEAVKRETWRTFIPTIRKPGSQIWVSFNPKLASSDTYQRWVLNPPPGSIVVKTSWRDNPWLSKESAAEIAYLRKTNPAEYEHVYEGGTLSTVEGAVYCDEFIKADLERRITRVPYDPSRPVDTFWDLGFADAVAIWFVQDGPFEFRFIDFEMDRMKSLDWYVQAMQRRQYSYRRCVLPWDGAAKNLGTGKSIQELLQAKGYTVTVNAQQSVADGINAVRTIFPACWFDADKCADGLDLLRRYQWGPNTKAGVGHREPLHDEASHAADALRTKAMSLQLPEPKPKKPKRDWQPEEEYMPFG